jgi:hypothetical protein
VSPPSQFQRCGDPEESPSGGNFLKESVINHYRRLSSIQRLAESSLTVLRDRAMDVSGRNEPCTFRQSFYGFASLCRSAIVSMIGASAGSAAGTNAESSSS